MLACAYASLALGVAQTDLARRPAPETAPVVYFDLTGLSALDLKDDAQRRRYWDETHLVAALQGLANRAAPRLFVRLLQGPDDFWWEQMTQPGGWLAGRTVERVTSLTNLLARFQEAYRGVVVWDERTPATSNLASTIAGCDDLLPLRFDADPASLYQRLTAAGPRLPVHVDLRRADGSPRFTGRGRIPDSDQPSTGSAKNDAYRWLIAQYVRTGKTNPHRLGYYLDAFWLRCWDVVAPENHTLANHDYVIAHRGALFDLGVWEDEPCVDDPTQPPGTDAATLKQLLRACYDRFEGDGVMHVAGFVPWAFKYTTYRHARHAAGGTHAEVPTEWRYAEILSCFNAFMDADALGEGAMANASFYQHFPLCDRYPQPPKPTPASLRERGLLEASGRVASRRFVAHYVGDYDSAAWLYRMLPRWWRDPARGRTPLSWAFNPNLSERFPLGMAWARTHATSNDWFVAGDSGAGYLNPGYLTEPRPHSGLPSGLAAWERHCARFYAHWDLSLTGFVIDGYARGLSADGLDAYARFSPDGIVAQQIPRQGLHRDMPYLRMGTDLPADATEAARTIQQLSQGLPPRFLVCRSILQSPSWYARVSEELQRLAGDTIEVVDLHTLLALVREYERRRGDYVDRRYATAAAVSATPGRADGLAVLYLADGPARTAERDGVPCWQVPRHGPGFYLYVEVDEAFHGAGRGPLEVTLEYLEVGRGRIVLEYDSTDVHAPHAGAYKAASPWLARGQSGAWRAATFRLEDARFSGAQNGGADLRFHNGGDDLYVRRLEVRRASDR